MELRRYWHILKRRWLLVLLPLVIVIVFSVVTWQPPPPAGFNVGVNFLVAQEPAQIAPNVDEERYYNWLTSEYIVNGLTDWAVSGNFKTAVSEKLAGQGLDVPPYTFNVVADNVRSKLQLSISAGDAAALARIMDAAIVVMTEENAEALPQLGGDTAVLVLLDEPVVTPLPQNFRSQLDIPLRIALALFAGIGLALLAEYLDPTLRDREETEQVGLTVLGEIPRQ
jgi:capsular polysaccharide biosynthesis protein